MTTGDELVNIYLQWLREEITVRNIGEWIEITAPFLDRHNDYIQIYVREENERLTVTDDGNTLRDLAICGCDISTPRRQQLLDTSLRCLGITRVGEELQTVTDISHFPQKKNDLIQAILTINDMFYTSRPLVQRLFYEDVVGWLDENAVRYTRDFLVKGVSGVDHKFNFVIPHSQNAPERFVDVISSPSKTAASDYAFRWGEIRDSRDPNTRAYAIINDIEFNIPSSVPDIFKQYKIEPIYFSQKDQALEALAA